MDINQSKIKFTAQELLSQAIEHEIDHLNGIMYTTLNLALLLLLLESISFCDGIIGFLFIIFIFGICPQSHSVIFGRQIQYFDSFLKKFFTIMVKQNKQTGFLLPYQRSLMLEN